MTIHKETVEEILKELKGIDQSVFVGMVDTRITICINALIAKELCCINKNLTKFNQTLENLIKRIDRKAVFYQKGEEDLNNPPR